VSTLEQTRAGHGTVAAVIIGNALDWYDFTLYGFFAATIGRLYFPAASPSASLLSAWGAFGVAYIVRPFGGIFLAQLADYWGRRRILLLVIAVMTIGTALIAFVPTYASLGLAAPIIIVISRLLQGFSAGGEFASATAYLVEHAPPRQRGLFGAWQFAGQGAAICVSGIAGWLGAHDLTPAQFEAWGWRLPFLLGLVIGPFGYYMRLHLQETPLFLATHRRESLAAPLRALFAAHKAHLLIGLGLVIGGSAALYVLFVFMPTYAVRVLHLDLQAAFVAPIVAGLTLAVFCPLMGQVADAIGRKAALVACTIGLLATPYPCFLWLEHAPSIGRLALVEFAFGFVFSVGAGAFNAALAEMFPVRLRATGMAVAYNCGVALFGGLAPLIVVWLIAKTGNALAPSYYVALCAAFSVIAALALPRTRGGEG
jgi:MFS family permease